MGVVCSDGDIDRLHVLVTRRRHLKRCGKVRPQLEPVHSAVGIPLWHLLVHDPAPCRHPLDISGGDGAHVAYAVAVLDRSRQDIRDRLDPPVGVPRKAREVILRPVIAEIVEEKERVELGCVAEAERASQVYTCAFDGRLGLAESLDRPDGHLNLLCLGVPLEVGVTFCRGMRAKDGQNNESDMESGNLSPPSF